PTVLAPRSVRHGPRTIGWHWRRRSCPAESSPRPNGATGAGKGLPILVCGERYPDGDHGDVVPGIVALEADHVGGDGLGQRDRRLSDAGDELFQSGLAVELGPSSGF